MKYTLIALATLTLFIAGCGGGGSSGGGGGGSSTPGGLAITTSTLAGGMETQVYTASVTATGGSGTGYMWSITAGSLPGGLSLSSTGTPTATIDGTPNTSGTFNFTVQVTDSLANTATAALQIVVTAAPTALGITSSPDMPDATVGNSYSESISATGGSGTYSWALTGGELPPGLSLASSGTPSTTLDGTPTAFGRFYFTVEVTDSASGTDTLDMNVIVVYPGSADSWPTSFNLVNDRVGTSVFTGSRILQFGGDFAASNGGEILFPGAGTYSSMTTTGAPPARVDHEAVWTGSRMLVHGGRDGSTYMRDIYSYDPVGDAWTAGSTTGAPSARANHTAVWTGTEMIVWGGHDGAFTPFDDGAAYNPTTDTWRTLAAVPTGFIGRERHKAVWTGSMMIIWGGLDNNGNELFDGAIYDPAADTWGSVTATGAPDIPSDSCVVVWTGTHLFVWGANINPAMIGAQWDPNSNSWASIGTWNVIRRNAAAVATPAGVFVWGGLDHYGTFAQNDGEFFSHAASNWFTMATPSHGGRSHAKAFWTGRQVILFGGKDFGFAGANPQSDGVLYNP